MKAIKPGDIFEIDVDGSYCYGICTHLHETYGELVRIVRGTSRQKITNHPVYPASSVMFSCFFPLFAAAKRGLVQVVARSAISEQLQAFPAFRVRGLDGLWWIWDGRHEHKVDALTLEEKRYPIRGIWNDTLLKERILAGYKPELDL